jgi:16S rRNA processing protein RimM
VTARHSASGESEWIAIAVLSRVRGNRGELAALSLGSKPERYQSLREVWLFGEGGPPEERFEIESVWFQRGQPIFKFRGIDSISDAERLAGAEVCVPFSQRAPLDEGEFYESDLVGCEIVDARTGETLGQVAALQDSGGPGLLQVLRPGGGEILIPFARSICVKIDTGAKRIGVNLPEGLTELNQT